MRNLDLWEDYIDTEQTLPLFPREPKEYDVPKLQDVDWSLGAQPPLVVEVVKRGNISALQDVLDSSTLLQLFFWLVEKEQRGLLTRSFDHLITSIRSDKVMAPADTLRTMVEFTETMPYVSATFANLGSWRELPEELNAILQNESHRLLRSVILSEAEFGELILVPFHTILDNVELLTLTSFSDLVELVALSVHSPSTALDLLLDDLDQQSCRLLTGRPAITQHFVHNIIGIAVEHIGAVKEETKARDELLNIRVINDEERTGKNRHGTQVEVSFRIDAPGGTPLANTHVRLVTASPPSSSILDKSYSMDGLVVESRSGMAKINCFHPPPSYAENCSWILEECGLFVTAKTMLDAVRELAILEDDCCGVIDQIMGTQLQNTQAAPEDATDALIDVSGLALSEADDSLNTSQRSAIEAAQKNKLICLWGPPGTGKTQTIVAIIRKLQQDPKTERILVTAPTHNAVDNVMRRYLTRISKEGLSPSSSKIAPLRVSTEVRKVGEDLRKYTCDALAGQEIHSSHAAQRQAKQRVKAASIIFTTCIGAELGLLRGQMFDTVIVDEASQQTEPASLVPLVKGCEKAILVGDHVQLRPTVQEFSPALGFDVSLFERLYTRQGTTPGMAKIMLDTQYRMHPSICDFISKEFYKGKLLSGLKDSDRPMSSSAFPWPASPATKTSSASASRMLFVECSGREDLGHKSKSNKEQADLCLSICKLLRSAPAATASSTKSSVNDVKPTDINKDDATSIAVLTPYSRQSEILKKLLSAIPNVEVSSIDGFQGREADIVIFVTVRCNESREIGFLKDLRRMNVALTRAKLGLIIVGNRATLTGGGEEEESTGVWRRLMGQLSGVAL